VKAALQKRLTDHDGVVSGRYDLRGSQNYKLVLLVVEHFLQANLDPVGPGPSEQLGLLDLQVL